MKLEDIKTIGVVGAGTMGQGIAQICAQAGYKTILFDINEQVLQKAEATTAKNLDKGIERGKLTEQEKQAALANLTFTGDTLQLSCDVIIEAIVEKLEVKQSIFRELADINTPDTILASNTSSIPITQIAAAVPNPERVVGMHFFNPAHIMKLVEVISGAATAPETAETIKQLAEKLGKVAVMAKDSPGFIVNRVARHFYVEGLKLLEEGVADIETIDKLMQASGFKMGPFELMDLIGVDTNYSVTTSMFEAFHYDPKFRPSRIQQQKVDAGHHGRKSGRGFYKYE
ncbi:3-hydroxyacyl-CoA dehydrogenase NAD-binding domain-containing protein [Pontibacter sp. H249]|uniref:3-hydroxyacyl-CoA dehydrogenase NAD-binding domain-containing protein n=1 Tax=Pontibacter sp. H249 TaxID=3133420 RepID=UPI0030C280FD